MDLFKDSPLWREIEIEKEREEKRSPAPGGIRTHNLLILRHSLHRCAANTATQKKASFFGKSSVLRSQP